MSTGKADISQLVLAIEHFLFREAEKPGAGSEVLLRVVPEGDLAALLAPKGGKLRIVVDALPEEMAPAMVAAEMGFPVEHPNSGGYTDEDMKMMFMPETTV